MSCRGTYDVPHQGRNRIDRVTELCEVVASEPVTNSFAELGAGGAGKWRRPRCGWCRYRAPGASGPGSEALVQAVVDLVGAQLLGEGAHCGVLVDDGQLEVADLGEVLPGLQVTALLITVWWAAPAVSQHSAEVAKSGAGSQTAQATGSFGSS